MEKFVNKYLNIVTILEKYKIHIEQEMLIYIKKLLYMLNLISIVEF